MVKYLVHAVDVCVIQHVVHVFTNLVLTQSLVQSVSGYWPGT